MNVQDKLPIEQAFEEGVAMFRMKYGCDPDSAHVSMPVKKAVLRLFKKRHGIPKRGIEMSMSGLPLFDLIPASPHFEIHMIKPVRKEDGSLDYWVQKMRMEPRWIKDGEIVGAVNDTGMIQVEGYEYDSREEAEWLTSESEMNLPDNVNDKLKKKIFGGC